MSKIRYSGNFSAREVVLQRAAVLFAQQGYKATSLRTIAAAFNMEAPSLYNHINSKNHILELICNQVAEAFLQQMKAIKETSLNSWEKFKQLLAFHVDFYITNFNIAFVADNEFIFLNEKSLKKYVQYRFAYENYLIALVENATHTSQEKLVNAKVLVYTTLAGIRGVKNILEKKIDLQIPQLKNQILQQLFKGIEHK